MRGRGGFGTTVHLAGCGSGVPLNAVPSAGQAHESRFAEAALGGVRVGRRSRPRAVAGDRAYDVPRVRRWLRARGCRAAIPEKRKPHGRKRGRPPAFDPALYRRRNAIERGVGWLKQNRLVATRYDKLAVNYLAFVRLAMIKRYLHPLFSDTT